MFELIRVKIASANYIGFQSFKELQKLVGATKFIIQDRLRVESPTNDGFKIFLNELALIEINDLAEDSMEIFATTQRSLLAAFDKFQSFLYENGLSETNSLSSILRGEEVVKQEEEIDLALLIVEQNNINYFKEIPSHLPSQPHERLSFHYFIRSIGGQYTFAFFEGSNLPQKIKDEAIEVVKKTAQSFGK